jgi:WD40 repeat protein
VAAFDIGDRAVSAVAFAGDGETLVVAEAGPPRRGGSPPGRVLLYDLTGAGPRPSGSLAATNDAIGSLAASPATAVLATGGVRWDRTLTLWRRAGAEWQPVQSVPDFSDWWHRSLAFSGDGTMLATVGGSDGPERAGDDRSRSERTTSEAAGPVQLWRVSEATGKLQPAHVLPGMPWAASALAFSPNQRFLAAGLGSGHRHPEDGQVLVWDLSASPPRLVHQSHPGDSSHHAEPCDITTLAWTEDGRTLVCGDQGGHLCFSRVAVDGRLEPVGTVFAHQRGVRSVVAAKEGNVVSSGNDGTVITWNSGGERVSHWRFGDATAVLAVALTGRHFAVGLADGRVYVLRVGEAFRG